MKEPEKITSRLIEAHGLTKEEYEKIKKILGREPNFTELGMFSVMWSEHCSYKSSKPVLKLFPTEGKNILVKAGEENAGVIDIGDNLAIIMKTESHNHPSAIEPFQGAATGVGGIIRDIFTMGARPIALLNSLCFGSLEKPRNCYLFRGVVEGIASYGNCVGIPTIGGQVYFDETYEGNPLVNVMCVGIAKVEDIVKGKATGEGNLVLYVGADTGRDGLGGASFASRELTEQSDKDRPAVQIGDPFREKLLLEACLELIKTGVVVGMQDMGAAGLTSSSSEMASRGNSGIKIDISRVPKREEGMIPYEVMLSESQERMLIIVKRGGEGKAKEIFKKWDLHAEIIGEVTKDEFLEVCHGNNLVAKVPVKALTKDAPVYLREEREPEYFKRVRNFEISHLPEDNDYNEVLKKLLDSPTISSKKWVYEQYDHMVRTNTVVLPGQEGAVLRIKGTNKAIVLTNDGNGTYSYLDPYEGGKIAVAEAARNIICTGGKPLAITDCLNFGNPTKPEVFWQFKKCVQGIARASYFLNIPVTGGNVSFYNENPQGAIDPTPMIGMLGIIEDINHLSTPYFKKDKDLIILLGKCKDEMGGSEFLKIIYGLKSGKPPQMNLKEEKAVQDTCLELIQRKVINSAHDLSEGGLAIALAESCIFNSPNIRGAKISLPLSNLRSDALLFGETQSRILISCSLSNFPLIKEIAEKNKVPLLKIGEVGGKRLIILREGKELINLEIEELENIWRMGIPKRVNSP
ncbi:phosphoribosylformylglycinamidine synthase subunit PurL [Candidatus Aerophobetes bacterium]|nr:phosphoribosylformylglycinamidine synthase subunit PurL [Candidatus Aerophobetes bacterium]